MAHPHFGPARYVSNSNDVPIPTTRVPTQFRQQTAGTLRRGKTLTRPERGVAPVPLIRPPPVIPPGSLPAHALTDRASSEWSTWSIFAHVVTFWAPPFLLSSVGGLKDRPTRQAWREKIALCFIALLLGGLVGFATVGLTRALCPSTSSTSPDRFVNFGSDPNLIGINGSAFNISHAKLPGPDDKTNFYKLAQAEPLTDITPLFTRKASDFPACAGLNFAVAKEELCTTASPCPLDPLTPATLSKLSLIDSGKVVGYDWRQVQNLSTFFVIDGAVLNMKPYFDVQHQPLDNDSVDFAIRTILTRKNSFSGRDGTRLFTSRNDLKSAVPCLRARFYAGNIDKITPGCFVSQLFLYVGLVVILGLVLVRFAMACIFSWFMSARLVAPPKNLSRSAISPSVLPGGANIAVNNTAGTAPWAGPKGPKGVNKSGAASANFSPATIGAELFTICLVTCYSEGMDSLRTTLDSISATTYSDSRKLLFVVCDGMVTGSGEKLSTPDICVSLLQADPRFGNPEPMGYYAVGLGAKHENRAMVYAGHYSK